MDRNYEELLEALKSHSERINHFITQLKQLKPSNPFYWRLWNNVMGKTSKLSFQQIEAPTNPDSPNSEQPDVVITVQEIIQDIKQKIQVLDMEIEHVVEKLSQYACVVSEKEKAETSVVQVYERDGNTADFVTALKERLHKRYKAHVIENVSDIDIHKPLMILCPRRSRLLPDITYSTELIEDLNSFSRLAIVIIHKKEGHALPPTSSQSKLADDVTFKNVWIIDAAFTNDLRFYDCKMNNEAIATLEKFLTSDTPI